MDDLNIGLIFLSLFCAGGLYAYVREALRLGRLLSSGAIAQATVVELERNDSGSESVVHYIVTYQFVDDEGNTAVHKQDLNSMKFFNKLSVGDEIEILYARGANGNSYPLSQIQKDRMIAQCVSVGLLLLWGVMGAFLI